MLKSLLGCCSRRRVSSGSSCPVWLEPASLMHMQKLVSLSENPEPRIELMKSHFDALEIRRMKFPKSEKITYIPLIEDPRLTLCIFYIPEGVLMPYHDHPRQNVLLRVLEGDIEICSCDTGDTAGYVAGNTYSALRDTRTRLRSESCTHVVLPAYGNIHEIKALTNSMFMDLVTPPYSQDRSITYFHRMGDVLTAIRERDMSLPMDFCQPSDLVDSR